MNAQVQLIPSHDWRRTDLETANIIELAIQLQGRRGTAEAARFLIAYGASLTLAARVLCELRRRRG
jgi:hypothetical protein